MRKAKRWRYYCDFCKKAGGSAFHMKNHESSCTKNPDRHCNMCNLIDSVQVPMSRLKAIISSYKDRIDGFFTDKHEDAERAVIELLAALKEETDGCPACILATLRQTEMWQTDFNFDAERKIFFDRVKEYREYEMPTGGY